MFSSTIRLGRVRGIELGANWSWLFVFGLITWSLAAQVFPTSNEGLSDATYVVMGLVASVMFFSSILMHELGHAIQAEREGMQVEGITLWIFGGVAKFTGMFPSAGAEFRIAVAGPLVTVAIATVTLTVASIADLPAAVDGVVTWLGTVNAILLVFNMLPAFPLDGGRVLRSALWKWRDDFSWATHIAGNVGKAFGQTFIVAGVLLFALAAAPGALWFAFIGWFLVMAANAESQLVTVRDVFAGQTVADLMVRRPQTVPVDVSLHDFVESIYPINRYNAYPVVDPDGRVAGILSAVTVRAIGPRRWPTVATADAMVPVERALVMSDQKGLADAVTELVQTRLGRALVIDDDRLAGMLSVTDVERQLALHLPKDGAGQVAHNG